MWRHVSPLMRVRHDEKEFCQKFASLTLNSPIHEEYLCLEYLHRDPEEIRKEKEEDRKYREMYGFQLGSTED